jgi:hypothetical protein
MEPHELQEHTEHAQHKGEKLIGLTMAIVAVILTLASLLGHRAHADEMLSLTQNVDEWDFYQAKHSRAYLFGLTAEMQALLPNGRDAAVKNFKISVEEECGVPAPKDCLSPVLKKSAVLQQLLAQTSPAPEKSESAAQETPAAAHAPAKSAEKHEKTKETVTKEGAVQIQERAREEQKEVKLFDSKADFYDSSELFLEISIVLCSIALLAEMRVFWRLSFLSTAIGVVIVLWGLFLR